MVDPGERAHFQKADIVIGQCRFHPNHKTIFFGRAKLENILKTKEEAEVEVARYSYDCRPQSESLEFFVALCQTLKGSHDYVSTQENQEFLDWMNRAME